MDDTALFALGLGIGRRNAQGAWLDAYFPMPLLAPSGAITDALQRGGLSLTQRVTSPAPLQLERAAQAVAMAGQESLAAL